MEGEEMNEQRLEQAFEEIRKKIMTGEYTIIKGLLEVAALYREPKEQTEKERVAKLLGVTVDQIHTLDIQDGKLVEIVDAPSQPLDNGITTDIATPTVATTTPVQPLDEGLLLTDETIVQKVADYICHAFTWTCKDCGQDNDNPDPFTIARKILSLSVQPEITNLRARIKELEDTLMRNDQTEVAVTGDVGWQEYIDELESKIAEAKADERKEIGEWGNELCTEKHRIAGYNADGTPVLIQGYGNPPRRLCDICWQEKFKSGRKTQGAE
jgi:hypothetical protein